MNIKLLSVPIAVPLLLSVLSLSGCQTHNTKSTNLTNSQNAEGQVTVEQMLSLASNQLNKTLPKMIDTETRLDNSYVKGNRFYYKSTLLNYYVDNMDVDVFNEEMSENTGNYICNSSDMLFFKENKIILVYSYYDDDAKFISDVIIDTGACDKLTSASSDTEE
ncbi:hypothetical protein [Psychrosphaera haliotis]|uniref:Uncharacterized protein n=1 Tax=Psychrosphaera haliotis TaxID=555083 RepID=A0A6N8F977_9GAMM|nr:hypothetical protein [Psychrosphaera haliotis]MUH71637.1 hypothetical protein [Psychrosphaera haliotis]